MCELGWQLIRGQCEGLGLVSMREGMQQGFKYVLPSSFFFHYLPYFIYLFITYFINNIQAWFLKEQIELPSPLS